MFLRKTKGREPVPLTMTGVRMGERVLQVGVDDPAVAGAIASRVGLSGTAAIATPDDAGAARARAAAERAGALVDIHAGRPESLGFEDGAFDVVVVHGLSGRLGGLDPASYPGALREWLRVLRQGGRIVVITPGPKQGLAALLRPAPPSPPGADAEAALTSAGFKPVRVVGELDGFRFTEGLKG